MTRDGTIVFTARTSQPAMPGIWSYGLWAADEEGIRPLMLVPRSDEGFTFISSPEVSSDGRLLFRTEEHRSGSAAILHRLWMHDENGLHLLAGPEEFPEIGGFSVINAHGLCMFSTFDAGRMSVWMVRRGSDPELVIRTGDTLQLGDVVRTVEALRFDGDDLNDRNEWVFQAYFTDGTTATMLAVLPEPSFGVVVLGLGLAGMGRRRFEKRGLDSPGPMPSGMIS